MHILSRAGVLITFGMLIICIASGCSDNPSEEVKEPPQSEDRVQLPRATTVVVNPPPPANPNWAITTNTEFTLKFDEEVVEVTVNDTPALGSGLDWKWSVYVASPPGSPNVYPVLPYGPLKLRIKWKNRDGSNGYSTVGPYSVADNGGDPPTITTGTVSDGAADVDPAPINAGGFRFDFDESVTGNIALTDEAGENLDWIANVDGQTATLTAVAGQELVNETTYKVQIDVRDGAGNQLKTTITFVTKPK